MNLLNFFKKYPTEEKCKLEFKLYRDQAGVTCKQCGGTDHYWKSDKWQYECKSCRFRTTLRSGTVMQSSKLPFQYWFIAMHLLTSTKKSFSALEVQKQIGHKRYEPIWAMLHKLRAVMGQRDDKYTLANEVELDDGFFETVKSTSKPEDKSKKNKRGRGSEKQTKVLVMAESKHIPGRKPKTGRPVKKVGYLKMKVVQRLDSSSVNQSVEKHISKETVVRTDGYTSYKGLKEIKVNHQPTKTPPQEASKLLPWVHIAISNAKRLLLGVFHRIDDAFIQNYLNEFVYKFNRRYFRENLFDRLLLVSVSYKWNYLG